MIKKKYGQEKLFFNTAWVSNIGEQGDTSMTYRKSIGDDGALYKS